MSKSKIDFARIKDAARGKWVEILGAVGGIGADYLTGRHGPCPKCQGTDRFRFSDLNRDGSILCNQCAPNVGDGIATVAWWLVCSMGEAAEKVAGHLGVPLSNGDGKSVARKTKGKAGSQGDGKGDGGIYASPEAIANEVIRQHAARDGQVGAAKLVAVYRYETFDVLRIDTPTAPGEKQNKTFRPIYPVALSDGRTAWRKGYPPGPRPPYRSAELQAAPPDMVVVCGGEKAAEALAALGLTATTPAGGEKAVGQTDWALLARFAAVAVSEDNDPTGQTFGPAVAEAIRKINPKTVVKIVRLPNLPPKGDVVEWIAAGGTREQFLTLVEAAPAAKGERIRNAIVISDGEAEAIVPIPMADLLRTIVERSENWPRRVCDALFVHSPGAQVSWLDRPAALFGWLSSLHGVIDWRRNAGCVSKEELFAELQRTAARHEAIDALPHEPPVPEHYYACAPIEPGDGTHLDKLLGFFQPQTPADRELLKAAFATPAWGGPPGTRPAILVTAPTGRGRGKSQVAMMIGRLYGGYIDISPVEDIGLVKQRLLSPKAAGVRVALLDNVKSTRFSWGELEALITTTRISGKEMYVGESTRPNLLTWIITLNGASLSTDMAQRVIEIRLADPTYRDGWELEVGAYIEDHRERIVGDVIGFLRQPAKPLAKHTRWGTWESAVLSKVNDPDACAAAIAQRRSDVDVEEEEAALIEGGFGARLSSLGYDLERCDVFIPATIAAEWFNAITGDRHKTAAVSRSLRQLKEEGRLHEIMPARKSNTGERGFRWVGPHSAVHEPVQYDLTKRLAEKREDRKHWKDAKEWQDCELS